MIDFNKRIKNSDKFRQSAIYFDNNKTYCVYPIGTTEYAKYWDTETDRCLNGYRAEDGDWISGYNYFYLNYCPILRLVETEYTDRYGNTRTKRVRERAFASFYDYDYHYFTYVQDCEDNNSHGSILKARGKGYEQPYSELVSTPAGFIQMGDLKVGDEVMNPNGNPTKIVEIFEQGYKDVFELTLDDGRKVKCGANHLWQVTNTASNFKTEVLTTRAMYQRGLYNTYNGYNHYRYYLEQISEVVYTEKDYIIHPYILGALLGDGTINRKSVRISTADNELVDKFKVILGEDYTLVKDDSCYNYRIVYNKRFNKAITCKFHNGKYGVNPLRRYLDELEVNKTHKEKFIPTEYKYGSIAQRYELVRGLMDTDGSISKDGSIEFTNTSKQLIEDLAEVLRSLGIRCEIGIDSRPNKFAYRLYIRTNKLIFSLSRKVLRLNKTKKINDKVAIINIARLDYQEDSRCIMVSNDNHMYLTRDYIPTHNSFKGASMLCRNYFLIPESKSYAVASELEFLTKDGLLSKSGEIMDFVDKHTAWAKKRLIDRTIHVKSGFEITDERGNKTEQGYLSEIIGISLKDKPDRIRGKRGKLILWEEAGMFKDILQAWQIARPGMEEGSTAFGTMLAYGCVCAGTKVWTGDGRCINIEDLKREDGIVGWNTYGAEQQVIENINPPSEKECVRVTTTSGRTLECSIDHPLLWSTPGKIRRVAGKRSENERMKAWLWHDAGKCKIGEQVGIIDSIPIFGTKRMWEPRTVGWLIGDGSYGINKTPVLSNCEDNINSYIENTFDTAIEKIYTTKDNKLYKETRIKGICGKLRELQIYGQTKTDKRLPIDIHTYDCYSITELIGGLFDTDGYVGVRKNGMVRLVLTQCQKEILLEVQNLLIHFGIHCTIRYISGNGRSHQSGGKLIVDRLGCYRLTIDDITSVTKFSRYIPLSVPRKQSALDLINIFAGSHLNKHNKYISGIHAERIVNIENIGVKPIYNVTAAGNNNYVANGIVTHNTGGSDGSDFEGLKELFYNPAGYNIQGVPNIWDENVENTNSGMFVPAWSNMSDLGLNDERLYMDTDGNSLPDEAMRFVQSERQKVIDGATNSQAVDRYIAENPINPQEACLELSGNIFPKKELIQQLALIRTNKKLQAHKQVGDLVWVNGELSWQQKKHGDITKFPLGRDDDPAGSIVIWEHPTPNPQIGLYIGGCDPLARAKWHISVTIW